MEVTFFGVRGSIPVPGPGTVRYGGNTGCVLVRLSDGSVVILDCGTGARNLGLELQARAFADAPGSATFLLSHAHWDHLQGFPFFRPFYVESNRFVLYGGAQSPERLEEVLEGQMAAQYFPLQTFRNMDATIEIRALPGETGGTARSFAVGPAQVRAHANPHGAHVSFAFRIEDEGKVLAYATDVGYTAAGPSPEALALYADADLLIHDATFSSADQPPPTRGLSSVNDAVDAALAAHARQLALFHYDQNYTDQDIDELVARGRRRIGAHPGATGLRLFGAAEGLSVRI